MVFAIQTSLIVAIYIFLGIYFTNSLVHDLNILYDISNDVKDRAEAEKEKDEDEKVRKAVAKTLYN